MKAFIFTIGLVQLCSSVVFSQGQAKPIPGTKNTQILLGAIAGANYSWTSFGNTDYKDLYKVKPVFGYHFGFHTSFKVRKRYFLNTSLIYSTKGMTMDSTKGANYKTEQALYHLKAKYNYLEMPIIYTVYFKGRLGKNSFKYSLGIGPNVSYWLGGKGTIENTDTHEFGTGIANYKVVFKKDPNAASEGEMVVEKPTRFQLGLNFTAGLLFEPVRNHEMILTLRYELGHSYLSRESMGSFDTSLTYFQQPLQIRNQGVRLSLAYLIDLRVEQRKKGKSTMKKSRK